MDKTEQELIEQLLEHIKDLCTDKYPGITRATHIRWEPPVADAGEDV